MWTTILALAAARAAAFVPAPPEVAALRLKETLNKKGFVRIPGAEFRALLRWKGAREEDLQLIESGAVHADVATDRRGVRREATPPSRVRRAGRVRRRGQGPVQAVRQPRLAAHAAGLRGVDGAILCGYQASGAP